MYLETFFGGNEQFLATASYIIPRIFRRCAGPWHFVKFALADVTIPVRIIAFFN